VSADPGAAAPGADEDDGPAAAASALVATGTAYVRRVVELAAAEARLAAISGISMLLMVIVAAALVVVAWALLASVAAYLLVALGLSWPAAGLILALANGIAAYLLWRGAVRLSRALTLPALRRAILEAEE